MEGLRTHLETVEDLTARLESFAEELACERQRYFDFFHRAPDPYLITDAHGLILEANAAAVSLAQGRSAVGKPIFTLVAPGSRRALRAQLALFAAGPQHAGSWPTVLRLPGGERTAEVRVRKMEGTPNFSWLLRRG